MDKIISKSNSYKLDTAMTSETIPTIEEASSTFHQNGSHTTDEKQSTENVHLPNGELVVSDISYKITERKGFRCAKVEKQILNNVNLVLRTGEVTALLGSSGNKLFSCVTCYFLTVFFQGVTH